MKRRDMLKCGVAGGAGAVLSGGPLAAGWRSGETDAAVFDQPSPRTTPFIDPLPLPARPNPVPAFLPDFAKYPAGFFTGFPSQHAKDIVDHVFALRDPGFSVGRPDFQDRPATMWYHDHLLDFTGPNVHRERIVRAVRSVLPPETATA
jgi:hypothetical protein